MADPAVAGSPGEPVLVGDVGGTHARFAITSSSTGKLEHCLDLTGEFATFAEVLEEYLALSGLPCLPQRAMIAVAGPVVAGEVRFTNLTWRIRESDWARRGATRIRLINDFAALAWAAPRLVPSDLRTLGPDIAGLEGGTISIVGAGTGFGVSCLARTRDSAIALSTEGGHVAFAPADEREIAVLSVLQRRFGRVSVERILSGPGLENLLVALDQIAGRLPRRLAAAEVAERAASGDTRCRDALGLFCSIYGSVAGDIALAHGALGGVFIAGGMARKIVAFLAESPFRKRFEDKGRLAPYVRSIPTRLICNPDAALLGAAKAWAWLREVG